MHAGERLERSAALDQDPEACRAGHAGDECDGCRENQWTGRGGDRDCQPADWIPGNEPGRTCEQQRGRQQEHGKVVGETNERRLRRLRRSNHANDAGIDALAGAGRRAQFEASPALIVPL